MWLNSSPVVSFYLHLPLPGPSSDPCSGTQPLIYADSAATSSQSSRRGPPWYVGNQPARHLTENRGAGGAAPLHLSVRICGCGAQPMR